ncbi:MAG TPA: nucleotidyltransferase family protein [Bacillota bacterium]|nr:nucleotidyltransferase family protein [Bacillota bacterium]
MAEGVVIAAGLSSRMGGANKLLLDLAGQTVIARSVSSLVPYCERIYLVTGHQDDEIKAAVEAIPGVVTVHNPCYREGMLSSAIAGLCMVQADKCVFLPGDCPMACGSAIERMLTIDADIVVPRYLGSAGHPVILGKKAIKCLLTGREYPTLRDFIESEGATYVDVDCPGILEDIDTEEDYRRVAEALAKGPKEEAR